LRGKGETYLKREGGGGGRGGGGGGGGRVLYDLLGRSVLCNPRTLSLYHSMFYCNFATLAILDVCLCNMWPKKKANEKSLHFVS